MKTGFKFEYYVLAIFLALLSFVFDVQGGSTKVGNGDEGSDLEGAQRITKGPIVDSRSSALEHLLKLNTNGIRGLGQLLPELLHSPIYLASKNSRAKGGLDEGRFHANLSGWVYARTFSRPHATTRFFPIAKKLARNQLIALHIHEALHRCLPEKIREDESKVTLLTLSLTAPGASHDDVFRVAKQLMPTPRNSRREDGELFENEFLDELPFSQATAMTSKTEVEHYERPSEFGYTFRFFQGTGGTQASGFPVIHSMHSIRSFLYPFGKGDHALGLGIEGSLLHTDQGTRSGPLGLSARIRVWTVRGFDIHAFGEFSLNTLSADELRNSLYGRDLATIGVSIQKRFDVGWIQNDLSYTAPGSSEETLGQITTNYEFGGVINVSVKGGLRLSDLHLGVFTDIYLSDFLKINEGPEVAINTGRYRIVSAGPEISYQSKRFTLGLWARFILDSTKNANFNFLGNIMGPGVSQGSIGATASINL